MNIFEVLYIDNYPHLDLHGFDRDSARVLINDFVEENFKLKNKYIVIVHGKGEGIIKKVTHDTLRVNKKVLEYHIVYNNIGSTIVKLKDN